MESNKIAHALKHFQATGQLYRHSLYGFLYTDGIKLMAELCEAGWLVSDSGKQAMHLMAQSPFVTIDLVREEEMAMIDYTDGNGNVLHYQGYHFTDFPLETFTMFFTNNTLLLPSEY